MNSVQPAIKKETRNVAIYCAIGAVLMFIVFFIWHKIYPAKVPFDYTVFLGGICGSLVALLNFFLMGLTVQKAVSLTDQEQARKVLKFSYTRRFFIQIIWCIIAIFVPCFQMIAGIIPLIFPSLGIKGKAIFVRPKKTSAAAKDAASSDGTHTTAGSDTNTAGNSLSSSDTPMTDNNGNSDIPAAAQNKAGGTSQKVPVTERISFNEVDE